MRAPFFTLLCCLLFTPILVWGQSAIQPNPDIVLCAHRGANHIAPENTQAAADSCIALGVQMVEVDVRQSKDGVLYIMHDRTVNRTTDGKGNFAKLTSKKIDKLDAGGWFGPAWEDTRVPRLKEYLEWIKGKALVYLDIKQVNMTDLVRVVRETGMTDQVIAWSGNMDYSEELKALAPEIVQKLNVDRVDEVPGVAEWGAKIVECHYKDLDEAMRRVSREQGLELMVYMGGANNREAYTRCIELGVDYLNHDKPRLALEILENY